MDNVCICGPVHHKIHAQSMGTNYNIRKVCMVYGLYHECNCSGHLKLEFKQPMISSFLAMITQRKVIIKLKNS